MASWQSVQMSSIVPGDLAATLTKVTDVVDQFIELQKTAINIAKVYQATLNGGGGVDVLKTIIDAVVDVIQGLLQAGKVHALFVPITKHVPAEVRAYLPPTLEDLTIEFGWDAGVGETVPFDQGSITAYAELTGASGGNAGFYNAFLQSLNDELDPARPLYLAQNDAVAMTVLLLGAPNYADAATYASSLGRIFKTPTNSSLTAGTVPIPRDLRARVIASPNTTKIAVRLDWQPAPPTFQPPYIPGVAMKVTRYAVIRSTDPTVAMNAYSVLDFFSTQDLSVGTTSDDEAKASKVIAVGNGLNSTYIDDTEELSADESYFYCVAWEVEVTEEGATKTLAFDRVSNVVKTRVRAPIPVKGVPPDWMSYGSPLALLPDLEQQVKVMLEKVKALGDRQGGGASGALSNALDMALANLERLATQLDQANAVFKRIAAIFGSPLPGIYTTTIAGTGGNAYLVAELAKRLNDKSDSSRPPFDDNQYVFGLCIVAGGPRLPDIQPVIDLLISLFQPSEASNPMLDVLTSLDAVVDVVEQHVFGQDLKAIPVVGTGATTTNPDGTTTYAGGQVTLPSGQTLDVEDFDNLTGLPKVVPGDVIADDGSSVDTMDPSNPNAGDTNKKDDSELC